MILQFQLGIDSRLSRYIYATARTPLFGGRGALPFSPAFYPYILLSSLPLHLSSHSLRGEAFPYSFALHLLLTTLFFFLVATFLLKLQLYMYFFLSFISTEMPSHKYWFLCVCVCVCVCVYIIYIYAHICACVHLQTCAD